MLVSSCLSWSHWAYLVRFCPDWPVVQVLVNSYIPGLSRRLTFLSYLWSPYAPPKSCRNVKWKCPELVYCALEVKGLRFPRLRAGCQVKISLMKSTEVARCSYYSEVWIIIEVFSYYYWMHSRVCILKILGFRNLLRVLASKVGPYYWSIEE